VAKRKRSLRIVLIFAAFAVSGGQCYEQIENSRGGGGSSPGQRERQYQARVVEAQREQAAALAQTAAGIQATLAGCTNTVNMATTHTRPAALGMTAEQLAAVMVDIAADYAADVEADAADGEMGNQASQRIGLQDDFENYQEMAYLAAINCGVVDPPASWSGSPWRSTWWATGTP